MFKDALVLAGRGAVALLAVAVAVGLPFGPYVVVVAGYSLALGLPALAILGVPVALGLEAVGRRFDARAMVALYAVVGAVVGVVVQGVVLGGESSGGLFPAMSVLVGGLTAGAARWWHARAARRLGRRAAPPEVEDADVDSQLGHQRVDASDVRRYV
ncbi:hypothetical protein [Cellulomonas sp. HZM]|uniref:hypothetical protein n=1 Tax=Cellulomonas sp. HZM TaxID=1454010 RepID=UPI000493445E|nr:hypothetical protein [Cellulomonas sp. HZM]